MRLSEAAGTRPHHGEFPRGVMDWKNAIYQIHEDVLGLLHQGKSPTKVQLLTPAWRSKPRACSSCLASLSPAVPELSAVLR